MEEAPDWDKWSIVSISDYKPEHYSDSEYTSASESESELVIDMNPSNSRECVGQPLSEQKREEERPSVQQIDSHEISRVRRKLTLADNDPKPSTSCDQESPRKTSPVLSPIAEKVSQVYRESGYSTKTLNKYYSGNKTDGKQDRRISMSSMTTDSVDKIPDYLLATNEIPSDWVYGSSKASGLTKSPSIQFMPITEFNHPTDKAHHSKAASGFYLRDKSVETTPTDLSSGNRPGNEDEDSASVSGKTVYTPSSYPNSAASPNRSPTISITSISTATPIVTPFETPSKEETERSKDRVNSTRVNPVTTTKESEYEFYKSFENSHKEMLVEIKAKLQDFFLHMSQEKVRAATERKEIPKDLLDHFVDYDSEDSEDLDVDPVCKFFERDIKRIDLYKRKACFRERRRMVMRWLKIGYEAGRKYQESTSTNPWTKSKEVCNFKSELERACGDVKFSLEISLRSLANEICADNKRNQTMLANWIRKELPRQCQDQLNVQERSFTTEPEAAKESREISTMTTTESAKLFESIGVMTESKKFKNKRTSTEKAETKGTVDKEEDPGKVNSREMSSNTETVEMVNKESQVNVDDMLNSGNDGEPTPMDCVFATSSPSGIVTLNDLKTLALKVQAKLVKFSENISQYSDLVIIGKNKWDPTSINDILDSVESVNELCETNLIDFSSISKNKAAIALDEYQSMEEDEKRRKPPTFIPISEIFGRMEKDVEETQCIPLPESNTNGEGRKDKNIKGKDDDSEPVRDQDQNPEYDHVNQAAFPYAQPLPSREESPVLSDEQGHFPSIPCSFSSDEGKTLNQNKESESKGDSKKEKQQQQQQQQDQQQQQRLKEKNKDKVKDSPFALISTTTTDDEDEGKRGSVTKGKEIKPGDGKLISKPKAKNKALVQSSAKKLKENNLKDLATIEKIITTARMYGEHTSSDRSEGGSGRKESRSKEKEKEREKVKEKEKEKEPKMNLVSSVALVTGKRKRRTSSSSAEETKQKKIQGETGEARADSTSNLPEKRDHQSKIKDKGKRVIGFMKSKAPVKVTPEIDESDESEDWEKEDSDKSSQKSVSSIPHSTRSKTEPLVDVRICKVDYCLFTEQIVKQGGSNLSRHKRYYHTDSELSKLVVQAEKTILTKRDFESAQAKWKTFVELAAIVRRNKEFSDPILQKKLFKKMQLQISQYENSQLDKLTFDKHKCRVAFKKSEERDI